jgi:ribosomal protein S18 acetylase RimI-like enzyme
VLIDTHLVPLPGFNRRDVTIRPIVRTDLPAVIALDAHFFGQKRATYFERRLAVLEHPESGNLPIFLAAEHQTILIGFVMGTLSSGEFSLAQVTAIVDSLAVHPRYQRQHIGKQLIEVFLSQGAQLGAKAAYTLVNWENWELLKVFHALGFTLASTIPLERPIE